MLILQASDDVRTQKLTDGSCVYYYNQGLPNAVVSFESSQILSSWRNLYQPFAFAIISPDQNECILIRDHFGIEPLYYAYPSKNKLIISQTIPGILKHLPSTPPFLENHIHMLFSDHKYYSDETLYQGIYRVEPAHLMHFKRDGSTIKKSFWQLDPHQPLLHYTNAQDYLDHFSSLMQESILNATANHTHIAAEFSAGLDSSAIYCAAEDINLKPSLYMNIASSGTQSAELYNDYHEKVFIERYQLDNIQRIGPDDFNAFEVFDEYTAWFAEPAPYIFYMFANPLHRAVAAEKHSILLSGFGGDQCVSGHMSLRFFLNELLHQGEYKQAWHELRDNHGIKKLFNFIKHMHPSLYTKALNLQHMKQFIKDKKWPYTHPQQLAHYSNAREFDYDLLQGIHSHEIRMRIEYSSIASKKMGFEYRYPLLYPKLLEFMFSIPSIQKRLDGQGRYLIRQYLNQHFSEPIFHSYRKKSGLAIIPSTFDLFEKKFKQGEYAQKFKNLPYPDLINHPYEPLCLRNHIVGFMLKSLYSMNQMARSY